MAGWKEYAHEIRKRATDYPAATVQHVAMYAKDNNRVYIIDENGNLVDFQVADIFCYNIDVSETAEVGETLSVSGNGYFWSDLHVEDNTFIGGIIDVSGNGYFWSDVLIDGNLLVNSNVAIGETLEVSGNGYFWSDVLIDGNLLVNSNVAIGETLEVSGNGYFYGGVVMGDDLEVIGDASISGSLYIAGKLTVDGLIDPTGLQLTPISANPGDSNTIWVNSTDSLLYFGGYPISGGGSGYTGGNISIPLAPSIGDTQTNITPGQIQMFHVGPYSDHSTWTKEGISFTQGSPSGVSTTLGKTSLSVSSTPNGTTTINDGTVTTKGVILTPTAANPGGATTTWVNSANNYLYFGSTPISGYVDTTATIPTSATFLTDYDNRYVNVTGDTMIGNLVVNARVDPRGVQFTPVASNPGDSSTLWVNSADYNRLYKGDSIIDGYKYVLTDNSINVANTNVETSCISGNGVGSLTIPGNILRTGSVIKFRSSSSLGSTTSPGTLTIRIKFGAKTFTIPLGTLPDNLSGKLLTINGTITFKSYGVSSSGFIEADVNYRTNETSGGRFAGTGDSISLFDTTIPNTFNITAQFSTAHNNNYVTTFVSLVEVIV